MTDCMATIMTEQASHHAVLNADDAPSPAWAASNQQDCVSEHPIPAPTLTQEDSLLSPQQLPDPSAMVSESFKTLHHADEPPAQQGPPSSDEPRQDGGGSMPSSGFASDTYASTKAWPSTPERSSHAPPRPHPEPAAMPVGGAQDAQWRTNELPPPLPPQQHQRVLQSQLVAEPLTPTKAVALPQPPPAPPATHVGGTTSAWRTDTEAEAAAARERDVAAAFAGLPRVRARWAHHYMKLLLVGDDGLGKTTFVRNLFAAYASDVDFPVADASARGASSVFASSPERLCTELVVKDEEGQAWWHYLVQDTPGYGDFDGSDDAESQREAILEHIRACSTRYYDAEADAARRVPLAEAADCRVDVALYFVAPHRLRRTDARFMRQLADLVPVVPLLAKADTMTPDELKAHRTAVHAALYRTQAAWQFSAEALEAAGMRHGPPFAVVGSTTIDRRVGRFWPVRPYPWGRCEPLLTAHSDLPAVRRLLFEAGYWEVKGRTEEQYLQYRQREAAERSNPVPRPMRGLLRLAAGVAVLTASAFLVVNLGPALRDETVRKETVRRVKSKVGDVVESAMDAVEEVKSKAAEATGVARSTAAAAVDTTKETGRRLGRRAKEALETDEVREAREEAARVKERRAKAVPWWVFWQQGGGLE